MLGLRGQLFDIHSSSWSAYLRVFVHLLYAIRFETQAEARATLDARRSETGYRRPPIGGTIMGVTITTIGSGMAEITSGVNWLAVIVGAVVSFGLGALWYSPKLFGTGWMEGVGLSTEDAAGIAAPMTLQTAGTLLFAWTVGVMAARDALLSTVLITATITFLIAANGSFAKKSRYAIMTEAGFIVAMAVVLVVAHIIL